MALRFNSGKAVKWMTIYFGKFWATVDLMLTGDCFIGILLVGDVPEELKDKIVEVENEDFEDTEECKNYVEKLGLDRKQIGTLGTIKLKPYFYFEWYSLSCGRCVVEIIYREDNFISEGARTHGKIKICDKRSGLECELCEKN